MQEPLIVPGAPRRAAHQPPIAVEGQSFGIYEWQGSGPATLHVHHADDEAWHVLEGTLHFRFADREIEAGAGSTVFVPAGVPHTYAADATARYLIVLTPRLRQLIDALHDAPLDQHPAIMRQHHSELLEEDDAHDPSGASR